VELLKKLNLTSYRFSISWPRIQADGTQTESRRLDYYKRLRRRCSKRKIRPLCTLYHGTCRRNRRWGRLAEFAISRDEFTEYAEIVTRA